MAYLRAQRVGRVPQLVVVDVCDAMQVVVIGRTEQQAKAVADGPDLPSREKGEGG